MLLIQYGPNFVMFLHGKYGIQLWNELLIQGETSCSTKWKAQRDFWKFLGQFVSWKLFREVNTVFFNESWYIIDIDNLRKYIHALSR